jgi:predicted MFS family arabinose efflux permease
VLGGFIATHWGWRQAFGLVALPGLVVAILFFFVKDYKTVELEKTVNGQEGLNPLRKRMTKIEIVREFTHTPSLLCTYLGFVGMMFITISVSTFLPTYFQRVQGVPLQKASLLTSGIMLMAIIGSPLGGWLADLWMKKKIQARLLLASISAFFSRRPFFLGHKYFCGRSNAIHYFSFGRNCLYWLGFFGYCGYPGCSSSWFKSDFLCPLRDCPKFVRKFSRTSGHRGFFR